MEEKRERQNPNLEGIVKCHFCGRYIQDKKSHPCYFPKRKQQEYTLKVAKLQSEVENNVTLRDYRSSASLEEFRAKRQERREEERDRREFDSLIRAQQDIKDLIAEIKCEKRGYRYRKIL